MLIANHVQRAVVEAAADASPVHWVGGEVNYTFPVVSAVASGIAFAGTVGGS